jgi:hypothetical protein
MTDYPAVSEQTWRNRFIVMNLVRIGGTAIVLLGLVIWQGDLLREGGWPAVGFPMAIVGLIVSFFGPIGLRKLWRSRG